LHVSRGIDDHDAVEQPRLARFGEEWDAQDAVRRFEGTGAYLHLVQDPGVQDVLELPAGRRGPKHEGPQPGTVELTVRPEDIVPEMFDDGLERRRAVNATRRVMVSR
jgi:hypothetical protein